MTEPGADLATGAEAPASAPLWQLLQSVAALVQGVDQGRSLNRLLDEVAPPLRAGTQALGFEVMRHLGTATALRRQLAPRRPAPRVDALLRSALALLLPEGAQPYAAFTVVNQVVDAAKRDRSTQGQAAFLNACLRRYLREGERLHAALEGDLQARWNHPDWWVRRLQRDHPAHWQAILQADQRPAPMDLRVHRGRVSVADYLAQLAQAGIEGLPLGAAAVRLVRPQPVQRLPGYQEGWFSVQSATAQRAAPLLMAGLDKPAPHLLDACAAPGGKTTHLLELCPDARVTALEVSASRSQRIVDNLERLGLQAEVRVADAADVSHWWRGEPYDAILLDAPCSASGIARRHPDVRWLRRESDLAQLATQQDRLLNALWPLLAPGGRMLYCTCSVFRQEGSERLESFVARNTDAVPGVAPGQLLPGGSGEARGVGDNAGRDEDGFFYALVHKRRKD